MIYESILDTIGNTPIVRLNRMAPANVEMYVKIEAFNPMASVKDRLAIAIIKDAKVLWRRGFGVRDSASKEPVDNDTVFPAASVSKTAD